MKKKILVTGAGGFVGKSLIRALIRDDYDVIAFDICDIPDSLKPLESKLQWVKFSFLDCALEKNFIITNYKNIDCCFHLATTLFPAESKENIEKDCYENVYCSIEFFSQLYKAGCKKIIYASSGGTVYGLSSIENDVYFDEKTPKNPEVSYGLTKSVCEDYLALLADKYNAKGISVRISNPYGEEQRLTGNQGVIPIFLNKIANDIELPIFGSLKSKRDYIYIDDLVSALLLTISYEGEFSTFNLCYGSAYSIRNIIEFIENCLNKKARLEKNADSNNDIKSVVLSNSRLRSELNWKPLVNLDEGIKRLAEYHKII